MKAETTERVCVYRNTDHEQLTSRELEQCRQALQGLLDLWHQLDIGPCQDINLLVMRPETAYKKAIDKLVEAPSTGKFAVSKEAYIQTLVLPDPSPLYANAKVTRQKTYCAVPELWSVDVDGRVILDELESAQLISSQSIFASTPDQVNLCHDIQKWCDLTNKLNQKLGGAMVDGSSVFFNRWIQNKFLTYQSGVNAPYEISPDPYLIRELLRKH